MYPDIFPHDRPSWCDDCGVKLDYDRDPPGDLCESCREARKDDPCEDCGVPGGEDCLVSCGSRLV